MDKKICPVCNGVMIKILNPWNLDEKWMCLGCGYIEKAGDWYEENL